jgi:GNAT superfamily N-acetyltransferase
VQELTIRDAVVADIPALCAVRDASAQHGAKLREADAGTARFLVGISGGDVVAFASVFLRHPVTGRAKSHIPKLSDCFVAREHRSLGIGRALVCARERIVHGEGFEQLYVSVDSVENPRWFDFFRRRGYRPLQPEPYRMREPRYSDEGSEAVLAWRQDMVLDLGRRERV